ncbi:dGTPase [Seinonella peptonophila]|uniref:Deoxyguanosinetriphosphate triphosphohydrolase-like protein n=1 Tax=Seinonella peptonophila TaxID=112248 RepID=A0A1M4TQ41_9BACL|nr:anti-phage deoxyguanosine triphosphatase [Seinonella peptonophila]SHE46571.1 dGTPase [Seinonella peptonophila]
MKRSFDQVNSLYQVSDYERFHDEALDMEVQGTAFEIDRARIIHSAAFRRLQAKTQVIGMYVGDLHRTRLTHSLEVAQIARQIANFLNRTSRSFMPEATLDASLVEAASLAHDLGHPPFGHRGEEALHRCMSKYGGFEANAHTFRLLTDLEGEHGEGLNLTRALLLSIMKYPISLDQAMQQLQKPYPPKASYFLSEEPRFKWVISPLLDHEQSYLLRTEPKPNEYLQTVNQSLECSLLEIADDIAYGTHDVEDAINLGLIQLDQLSDIIAPYAKIGLPPLQSACSLLENLRLGSEQLKYRLKRVFTLLISAFIASISLQKISNEFSSARVKYRVFLTSDMRPLLDQLHRLVADEVIYSHRVQTVAYRGSYIIQQLFDALMEEHALLPRSDRIKVKKAETEQEQARIVCDYIAGMTDSYAMKVHARLFGPSDRFFDD